MSFLQQQKTKALDQQLNSNAANTLIPPTQQQSHLLLAIAPGILALTLSFGIGILINLALCLSGCTLISFACQYCSGTQTPSTPAVRLEPRTWIAALFIGLALPPYCPWWLPVFGGTLSAIFLFLLHCIRTRAGNRYYLNPAMTAYLVLLLVFPAEMSRWFHAGALLYANSVPSVADSLAFIFGHSHSELINAYTGATPLDVIKNQRGFTLDSLLQTETTFNTGLWAGAGWEIANLAFLGGGIFLINKRCIRFYAPLAMLLSLVVLSLLFFDGGSSSSQGSATIHLLSGGTMFAAFFVLTDPASLPNRLSSQIILGTIAGTIIFILRALGDYADGVVFSILILNVITPVVSAIKYQGNSLVFGQTGFEYLRRLALVSVIATLAFVPSIRNAFTPNIKIPPEDAFTKIVQTAHGDVSVNRTDKGIWVASSRPRADASKPKILAYGFITNTPKGYVAPIRLLLVVGVDNTLLGIEVLHHRETTGFGDKIESDKSDWLERIQSRRVTMQDLTRLKLKQDGGDFDQLSGATLTSRAFIRGVQEGMKKASGYALGLDSDADATANQ